MGAVFSQLQTPLLYAPLTKAENELRKTLMWEIETILEKVKLKKQYRDQKRKKFDLEWSFLLGHTCNALGATSFETPHNFKQGRGVNLTPVEDRNLPKWKKQLWALSKELITLFLIFGFFYLRGQICRPVEPGNEIRGSWAGNHF